MNFLLLASVFIAFQGACILFGINAQGADTPCETSYHYHGCFEDTNINPKPFPDLLITDRDPSHGNYSGQAIQWGNWDSYFVGLICRCAEKAKTEGNTFFGIEYYGECWSGKDSVKVIKYIQDNINTPEKCVKEKYVKCAIMDTRCIGEENTESIYELS